MLDRRSLLVSSSAAAAALAVPRLSQAQTQALTPLLDQFFAERLRRRPEQATQLGLDKGANADLKAKLSDESEAGIAAA